MKNEHCKHWAGSINNICNAGVDWQEVTGGEQLGIMRRCPCINPEHKSKCDKHEFPTEEELKAEEEWLAKTIEQFEKELPFWNNLKSKHKRGTQGKCKCPRCDGTCDWSIAATNGHLWVRCQTENCIAFME